MTLRCNGLYNRIKNRVSKWNATGISLLLVLSAIGSTSVNAQQDSGADVPPPPQVRQGAGDGPDPDFRSPMRRNVQELGDDGGDFSRRRMRRQQMMQQQMEGGDPAFGGPGGPGMGFGQGMRRGMGGPGGPGGFGGRRQGGATMGGGFGRKLDLTPLNLSEEQKSRIKQIRQGTRERAKDVRRALMGKQMALRNMIFSPDATDAQIRATRKEVRKMQDEMEELNLEDLLAIRGVLTAEQKQRLPQIAPGPRGPRTASAGGPGGGKKRLSQDQRSAQK